MTPVLAILGPTASGKSALALEAAQAWGGEIVSVDSAQVFRGLDVGTAKPTLEERARVPHHVLDCIEPTEQWSAAQFRDVADAAIADVKARGRLPILCGGTGLWYRALIHGIFEAPEIDPELRRRIREELSQQGSRALHARLAHLDPEAAARIAPGDPQRIGRALEVVEQTGRPISELQAVHGFQSQRHPVFAVALRHPRPVLWERIRARTEQMYGAGWLQEVRGVLARGVPEAAPGLRIIGYRDVVEVVHGRMGLLQAREATYISTRQFAKRQVNWFNQERTVTWVDAPIDLQALQRLLPPDLAV